MVDALRSANKQWLDQIAARVDKMACAGGVDVLLGSLKTTIDEPMMTFSLSNASIEGCAFFRLVRFLYTGTLQLCDVTIAETVRACSFLHVSSAMDLCEKYLLSKMQPCNALSICALGNLFDCGNLEEQADEYLNDHFTLGISTVMKYNLIG